MIKAVVMGSEVRSVVVRLGMGVQLLQNNNARVRGESVLLEALDESIV